MRLEKNQTIIYIDDNSIEAQKITDVYYYDIVNGKLVFGNIGTDVTNKYQALKAIDNINTLAELKVVLKKIVNKLL